MRASMQMAPWPGAGGNSSSGINSVMTCASPSRFSPALASSVPSTWPSSSLRKRVCTLPRKVITFRSGRMRRIRACRRKDDDPTVAPCGSSLMVRTERPMKASRGSSRGRKARRSSPSRQRGRHVLRRMHRDIDAAVEQRLLDLLGEQALAAGFRERPVLDTVAAGRDRHDLESALRQTVRRHQPGTRLRWPAPVRARFLSCRFWLFPWRAVRDNPAARDLSRPSYRIGPKIGIDFRHARCVVESP